MSNGSTFPPPRRLRGTTVLVVLAAVLVAAGAGYLVLRWLRGDGGEPPRAAHPAPSGTRHEPDKKDGKGGTGDGSHDSGPGSHKGNPHGSLKGKTVVLDPGHNPRNRDHTREIARLVDIGNERKECDTTGTSTNTGYAEASFTLDVAHRARKLLERQGARVVLTQDGDHPYGPCVDERAATGNKKRADAAVSIHADGSAAGNRGFHVILPARVTAGAADTSAIVAPSRQLGERLAGRFLAVTESAPSNYIGDGTGLDVRSDLGGLNLSTVPKVFIECGNMRDPKDAAHLTDAEWRQKAARGITEGITDFLTS
ncbi:N-acetylmuramoyl-L-alanine amidase [Streptomyces chattanoogensis]|uniref:N-acetylmuramoyl-L-alanine amidase n=1 Tax=Streptomyces chattanoogensis TaxID=66876 RepID=A0A0N0XUH2_9ACTN|nr:N-acetylmuramoyl-L-alanine amidase [Streptomyces chattanoogensis]KPC62428.1 N-acetylmuramoyl-L-alanine amidase [Streptomyces chattanoogensis]